MLGEGTVSFGVLVVTVSRRKAKSSPKIVCSSPIRSSTWIAAGVNSIVPSSLKNCTVISPGALPTPRSW